MEPHGGRGDIYAALYHHVEEGIVFEKNAERAEHLAHQRPFWAVYEADCTKALALGAGAHLPIKAFMESKRPFSPQLIIVVNDGLRTKARGGGAWDSQTLSHFTQRWGNHHIWNHYLEACEEMMQETAELAHYHLHHFDGYHCGIGQKLTHYLAVLRR